MRSVRVIRIIAPRRATTVCAAMFVLAALVCGSALAGGPAHGRGLDGGRQPLIPAKPAGVGKLEYREWLAAGDGSVYVLATSECSGCGDEGSFLFRFLPGGGFDASFGRHGHVKLPGDAESLRLAVDLHGRAVVSADEDGIAIRRFTRRGHPDPRFGRRGVVRLPKNAGAGFLADPSTATPMPDGGLLVATETPAEGRGFARVHLAELREDGAPIASFGHHGVIAVDAAGAFHDEYGPTPLRGGGVLIGAEGCCTEKVSLTLVSARGRLDTRFDRAARRALQPLTALREKTLEGTELNAIVPRPDGGFDLFGFASPHGFEVRINQNGEAETHFGRRGLRILPLPVSTAVAIPGGGFLVAGNEFNQQSVAYVVRGDGTADRRFRPTGLGSGSFYPRATILRDGDGSIAYGRQIRGEEEFQYRPVVARFVLPRFPRASR